MCNRKIVCNSLTIVKEYWWLLLLRWSSSDHQQNHIKTYSVFSRVVVDTRCDRKVLGSGASKSICTWFKFGRSPSKSRASLAFSRAAIFSSSGWRSDDLKGCYSFSPGQILLKLAHNVLLMVFHVNCAQIKVTFFILQSIICELWWIQGQMSSYIINVPVRLLPVPFWPPLCTQSFSREQTPGLNYSWTFMSGDEGCIFICEWAAFLAF